MSAAPSSRTTLVFFVLRSTVTSAAVFRPRLLRNCRQSKHYAFHFDGRSVTAIDELETVWTAPG